MPDRPEAGIDPGRFDRLIGWEARSGSMPATSLKSDPGPKYLDPVPVWAEVQAFQGREQVNAQQVKPETWYRVRLRNEHSIKKVDRFDLDGIKLNIDSIYPVGTRGAYLECLCIAQG